MDFLRVESTSKVTILDDSFNDDARINHPTGTGATSLVQRASKGFQVVSASLDLSAAASKALITVPENSAHVTRIAFIWTEASSSDAGITVTVEAADGSPVYFTGTSSVSQAIWTVEELSFTNTLLVAGDAILLTSAGSKVGAGDVAVLIEYAVDQ